MTSAEFVMTLEYLGISTNHYATMLDVNPRTVRRWAGGTADVPDWVVDDLGRLMRYTDEVVSSVQAVLRVRFKVVVELPREEWTSNVGGFETSFRFPSTWVRRVVARAYFVTDPACRPQAVRFAKEE